MSDILLSDFVEKCRKFKHEKFILFHTNFLQRSTIAQKLLLQLLLNFQYPITITKLFFCIKRRHITITSAITFDYYNIILNLIYIFLDKKYQHI